MHKIIFISRDDGGCCFFRCIQPASFIKRMGLADTEVLFRTATHEQLRSADLVIFQEIGSVAGSNMARFCLQNGIPYIVEIDDFLQHVSPNNDGGFSAWNPGTLYLHRAMETARAASAMTVSTEQLAREYFPYNRNIFVVPNRLDSDAWDIPIVRRQDGKIRIGWAGGNAHADDLRMVSKVLARITKESDGNVLFETVGMTKHELAGVFPMEEFTATCPHCGFEGELHHFPGEQLANYPLTLAGKGWDIAIAPLIDNAFNNAKSNLKIMEYAALGLPIVATPARPYVDAEKEGAQIVFASTFEEWYEALTILIKDADMRATLATKNREWSQKNWIQDHAKAIFEIYEEVIRQAPARVGIKELRLQGPGMVQ